MKELNTYKQCKPDSFFFVPIQESGNEVNTRATPDCHVIVDGYHIVEQEEDVFPLGPVAPKVARIISSLHDNSNNSRAITPPVTHRLFPVIACSCNRAYTHQSL